ncbi:GNAT family N-acetyltransferase [Natronosalvus vescus]|uniref:GNAT family N-acetyltransferase n=1 Tax=Natronosalvus vescus TaxID=2953881 RepID=UPI002091E011|nr:GNAT family N-acetyltransferase [Natronosalvus vescus]
MTIEVEKFTGEADEWDRYIDRSPTGTIFHLHDFLETVDKHVNGTVIRLIGYNGQEPIGVIPFVEIKKFGISTAFSPAPRMGLPYQGPILLGNPSPKRRKQEKQHKRFIENSLTWLDNEIGPSYVYMRTHPAYDDPRPFAWNGFTLTPRYTYCIDVTRDIDEIKMSFSKSLRRYLDPDEDQYRIEEQGEDGIRFIYQQTRDRYEAQDKTYAVKEDFLLDLYNIFPDGWVRPYVGIVNDERVAGILIFDDGETIYFQEGGAIPDVDFPINDILHWHIIKEAKKRGVKAYDLHGANTPRLCKYKSKFNPELEQYYGIEKGTRFMNIISEGYKKVMF